MPKSKVEVVFIKKSDEPNGFTILGNFNMDSDGPMLSGLTTPSIGERVVVDLPDKAFSGQVTGKETTYAQKDMEARDWDWVTRIILTLEVDAPNPYVHPNLSPNV